MTVHDFDMARCLLGSDVRGVCAKADVLIDPLFDKIDWDTAVVTLTSENGAWNNSQWPQGGIRIRSEACGSVRFQRDDCNQQAMRLAATKSVKESSTVTTAEII
jgi:predicted dehydrogenase